MITVATCGWLIAGGVLDAWAHTNLGELETFFTPWHGVVYTGFAAVVAWLVLKALQQGRAAVPVGYGLGLVGVAIFLLGGVGDAIWHSVFGLEVDLEAVLSPPHIALTLGAVLVVTVPLRAAWSSEEPAPAPTLRGFLPALLSLTLTTTLLSLYSIHLSAFHDPASTRPFEQAMSPYLTYTRENGVVSVLVTNLLLVAPLLLIVRRWRPPFGSATILFTTVALGVSAVDEFSTGEVVLAASMGGLAADSLIARFGSRTHCLRAHRLVAAVTPLALWTSYFLILHARYGLAWTTELWVGSIVLASLSALALSVLMAPTPMPKAVRTRPETFR